MGTFIRKYEQQTTDTTLNIKKCLKLKNGSIKLGNRPADPNVERLQIPTIHCVQMFGYISKDYEPRINHSPESSTQSPGGSTDYNRPRDMGAKKIVELYYDIISPYSWIGFELLLRYKTKWNLDVRLKPFFLGGVMHSSGNKPPGIIPNKAAYMVKEIEYLSNYYQIPIRPLSNPARTLFEKGSLNAMRFVTAVDMEKPELTEHLSRALWMRVWNKDQDISDSTSLIEAAKDAGLSESEARTFVNCIRDQKTKDRLKQYTQEALNYGAFGAPTFILEDSSHVKHMIFGSDRMHIIAMLLGEKYEGPLLEYAKSRL